ncbi:MAG: delta-60 repeat domain-containing protein [Chthoniobacteraceae bacterium]
MIFTASPGGGAGSTLTRVNPDGSIDAGFSASTAGFVSCIAVLPDGKVLIGGNFTSVNGTARNGGIARLNADGTLDPGFNAGSGADNSITSLLVQADGKIVVAGYFTTFNNTAAGHFARLEANGTLDGSFNIGGAGTDIVVFSLAQQADGKLLLGGWFSTVNGAAANRIARLETNGTLDTGFSAGVDGGAGAIVHCVAVQPDGKVVIGGNFASVSAAGGWEASFHRPIQRGE